MKARIAMMIVVGMVVAYSAVWTDARSRVPGTFSSLRFSSTQGDLTGVEIKIVPTQRGYQGALQIADGRPSQLMLVAMSSMSTTGSSLRCLRRIPSMAASHSKAS